MRVKNLFKQSVNLWFVGLLTIQFCVGLVYALDAERVHDSGQEMRLEAYSIGVPYSSDSKVSVNIRIQLPYEKGANSFLDEYRNLNRNIPYRMEEKIDVEFRKGDDGIWTPVAYGLKANPQTGVVLELKPNSIIYEKFDGKTRKQVKLENPLISFNSGINFYYTREFYHSKLTKIVDKNRKTPKFVNLRYMHGMLAINSIDIGDESLDAIIAERAAK